MALELFDNTPNVGYISWTGLTITYRGAEYNVNDGNSNKKYIWWDYDEPTDLQDTDLFPPMAELEDALVFYNNNGIGKFCLNQTVIHGDQIQEHSIGENQLAVGAAVPIGAMMEWPKDSAPDGWLLCHGQSLVRAGYPDLFAVIGTIFGAVDGAHFNLPDTRDRFSVGAGNTYALNNKGGFNTITLTLSQIPSHNHSVSVGSVGNHNHSYTVTQATSAGQSGSDRNVIHSLPSTNTGSAGSHGHSVSQSNRGSGNSHENRPPYIALHRIIKF